MEKKEANDNYVSFQKKNIDRYYFAVTFRKYIGIFDASLFCRVPRL